MKNKGDSESHWRSDKLELAKLCGLNIYQDQKADSRNAKEHQSPPLVSKSHFPTIAIRRFQEI